MIMRRVALSLLLLSLGATAEAKPRSKSKAAMLPTAAVSELVQQAKVLLAQGDRQQAYARLDKARESTKSKSEHRELAAKKVLFAEQFLTSEAFSHYQRAKALFELDRWEECLRELDSVGEKDQDNLIVLRLRSQCELSFQQLAPATKTLQQILAVVPDDIPASFSLVRVALAQKDPAGASATLERISPRTSSDIEQHVILKARALEMLAKPALAAEILKEDQDEYLDHVEVIHELGMLYTRMPGHDWQARKMLSLFITRCRRMKEADLQAKKFDKLLPVAQSTLILLDKKLGV